MAENVNFISAKDLPITEAEKVNVLCVDPETGEMAQKEAENLGGGGSAEPDAVFMISSDISGNAPEADASSVTLLSGSMEAIKNKIEAGLLPTVYFVWQSGDYAHRVWTATNVEYDSYEMQVYIGGWYHRKGLCGTFYVTLTIDNEITGFTYNGW